MLFNLDPATLISRIIILIFAFTCHELAHAAVATYFGDETPRLNGRLTLNPFRHLDPMGSLLLLVAGFGWAKPVPINPYALQRRSSHAVLWVSFAGPCTNLILAALAAIPFRLGMVSLTAASQAQTGLIPSPAMFLISWIYINLLLFFFNLLPIAPLDGEKIAFDLLPQNMTRYLEIIHPYGPIILLALFLIGPMLGLDVINRVIMPPLIATFRLLVG